MDYKESEAVKSLIANINLLKPPTLKRPNSARNDNKLWNALLLFSNIILASKSIQRLFPRKEFEKFVIHYNQQNLVNINVDFLFNKFWLREVLRFVHIPDAVRSVTYDYEKYRDYKTEVVTLPKNRTVWN